MSPHRPARPRRLLPPLALAGTLAAVAALAQAQDSGGPNPGVTLSFGSTFKVDDNLGLSRVSPGTSTWIDNRFGLSYTTETQASRLAIGASGVWRLSDLPGRGRESDFDNPTLSLEYGRSSADSSLSLAARLNRADVAFRDAFDTLPDPDEPLDSADLSTALSGTLETRNLSLGLVTGEGGPIGTRLEAERTERDYQDTADPDLYDSTRDSLAADLILRPRQTTQLSFGIEREGYSAENPLATDRDTRRARIGLAQDLDPRSSVSLSLGRTWLTERETLPGGAIEDSRSGFNGSLGLTREVPDGSYGLTLSRDISYDGAPRTDLLLSRQKELPNGRFAISAGPSRQADGDSGLIGNVSYSQPLPLGAIDLSYSRSFSVNDESETVLSQRGRASLRHELTPVSGLDLSLDYATVEGATVSGDRERGELGLSYSHDLTPEWALSGGVVRAFSRRADQDRATSNSLFLTINRAFSFAP